MTRHAEDARRWFHLGAATCAFLLRFLTSWQAAAFAATALAFNLLVLPRVGGRRLYQPVDHARGTSRGILLYPLAVLVLILAFSTRLDIVAAAWAILGFGDGAAALVHRRGGGRRWSWNREKTVAGTMAFALCGALGGVVLAWWTRPNVSPMPSVWFTALAPLAAAVAAACVETIPIRLDDHVSIPAAAGAVLWLASLVTMPAWRASWPVVAADLPWAVGVNALFAWAGWRAGTVSRSGAIAGTIVGIVIYAAAGRSAWILLFATLLAATVASRLGLQRKVLLGIEEERGGQRGAGNALANCGVAAIAALAVAATPYTTAALLALVAALTAGGSDTVASEIGKAWGRSTFLVTSLRRVKPGTPGAVSPEGTAAGVLAAFALAALAVALGQIAWAMIVAVVIGATAGAIVESVLAATVEGPGILNNDTLNFINTAVAAAVALAIG